MKGCRIWHEDYSSKETKKLQLSQEEYVEKVLKRFGMDKLKVIITPLTSYFKL